MPTTRLARALVSAGRCWGEVRQPPPKAAHTAETQDRHVVGQPTSSTPSPRDTSGTSGSPLAPHHPGDQSRAAVRRFVHRRYSDGVEMSARTARNSPTNVRDKQMCDESHTPPRAMTPAADTRQGHPPWEQKGGPASSVQQKMIGRADGLRLVSRTAALWAPTPMGCQACHKRRGRKRTQASAPSSLVMTDTDGCIHRSCARNRRQSAERSLRDSWCNHLDAAMPSTECVRGHRQTGARHRGTLVRLAIPDTAISIGT